MFLKDNRKQIFEISLENEKYLPKKEEIVWLIY